MPSLPMLILHDAAPMDKSTLSFSSDEADHFAFADAAALSFARCARAAITDSSEEILSPAVVYNKLSGAAVE